MSKSRGRKKKSKKLKGSIRKSLETERKIPSATKREVRQRCGFGCVICGLPFYEYEHMIEFSKTNSHEAENITLLCPNHHAEKTRKVLPLELIREANNSPFNLRQGYTSPYKLHYSGATGTVKIGNITFPMQILLIAHINCP